MGKNLQDRIDIKRSRRSGNRFDCGWRGRIIALDEKFSSLGVDTMAGFHSHDMAPDETPRESKVAHNIKNLVANELIGKAKRLFAEDAVATGYDGIFKAPPLMRPLSMSGLTSS